MCKDCSEGGRGEENEAMAVMGPGLTRDETGEVPARPHGRLGSAAIRHSAGFRVPCRHHFGKTRQMAGR